MSQHIKPSDDYNRVLLKMDEGRSRDNDPDEDEEEESSDEEDEESTQYINASHIDVCCFIDTLSSFSNKKHNKLFSSNFLFFDVAAVISLTLNSHISSSQLNLKTITFITFYLFGWCTTIDGCVFVSTQGYWGSRTFIAAQTPLPDTIADFWAMVYQKKASTIVMLSDSSEGDKVLKVSCMLSLHTNVHTIHIQCYRFKRGLYSRYTIHIDGRYIVNKVVLCFVSSCS